MMVNAQESPGHRSKAMNFETRAKVACQRVRMGEVSRGRQCLTGASLAPGTQEALEEMQNQRPQEGRPTIARGGPELYSRVASEVGSAEVFREFEECSARIIFRTRRMHVRAFEDLLG